MELVQSKYFQPWFWLIEGCKPAAASFPDHEQRAASSSFQLEHVLTRQKGRTRIRDGLEAPRLRDEQTTQGFIREPVQGRILEPWIEAEHHS